MVVTGLKSMVLTLLKSRSSHTKMHSRELLHEFSVSRTIDALSCVTYPFHEMEDVKLDLPGAAAKKCP